MAGAVAGPLYVCVGTLEALLRRGFDIRIHSLSLLANGSGRLDPLDDDGDTGLLTVIGALGMSSAQQRTDVRTP